MHTNVNQANESKSDVIRRLTAIARMEEEGYTPEDSMYEILLPGKIAEVQTTDDDYKKQRRIYNYKNNPDLCQKCWTSHVSSNGLCKHLMVCGEWRSDCKLCHNMRAVEEMEILREWKATSADGQLYYLWIEDYRWDTVYKFIKRNSAKYSRFPQGNGWCLVYVNSDLDGRASPCDIEQVAMSAILHDVPLFENISHSKGSGKGKGGNGNGGDDEEEKDEETKTIRLLQMVHYKYEENEEAGFAEAMRQSAKKVETFEELEKVMNGVLVTYSGIMGKIVAAQSIYQTVSQQNINEWNRTVSEYFLSFKDSRKELDKPKPLIEQIELELATV